MSVVFGGSEASAAHSHSAKVSDSALDLFTVPPTNVAYNSYHIVEINPTIESTTPVELVLPGSREFIDFTRSYFHIKLSLKDSADNANVAKGDNVWMANNAFHTIFKQPSIYINGTLTTEQTDTYAYKAYIETILNYSTEDEETFLQAQGYYSAVDHPPSTLSDNEWTGTHADYKAMPKECRKAMDNMKLMQARTVDGKVLQLFGMPHCDLLNSGRMLIPGVDLKTRFTLNDPKFFLMRLTSSSAKPVLKSFNMKFFACMVKVRSDIYNEIARKRLKENKNVFIPTVRSEVRTFTVQKNDTEFQATDVFTRRVPHRVVVGLVYQSAFGGHYEFNPFSFQKNHITSIKQVIEGEEYLYTTLELNSNDADKDMEGYNRLLMGNCCKFKGRSNQNIGNITEIPRSSCGTTWLLDAPTVFN